MTTICYPAIPGVPGVDAVFNTSANLGWNAGAASVTSIPGDGTAEFSFGVGNVGSLAGFAPAGAASGAFNAVTHGLLYSGDTIKVVEGGVQVADSGVVPATGLLVRISRVAGVVTYNVDGWVYTSASNSFGDVQLYAALYAAGDYIDDPSIWGGASIAADSPWGWSDDVTRRSMRARSSWGWSTVARLNDGEVYVEFDMAMLASDYALGELRVDAGGVQVAAQAGFSDVEASGVAFSVDMGVAAVGTSVIGGSVDDDIQLYAVGSEAEYGYASGDVADVSVLAVDTGEAPGTGSYTEGLYLRDIFYSEPIVYALLSEDITVGSTFDVLIAVDAALFDTLVAIDECDATSVLYALISSGIQFSDDAGATKAALLQYATNLLTGAVTRYDGFEFSGFCSAGMDTYGWKADGLYKIGAESDNGARIAAMVDFSASDFGTTQRKRVDSVFFGIDTDGSLFAKVVDDNDTATTYRVLPRGSESRANLRRGNSSRFWRLQLQIVDATYADLDNVEWVVGSTGRRTTR